MNIFDLPIETDESLEDKSRAFIFENKIVCHPDLEEKVIEGMSLMRASASGFEKDMIEINKNQEKKNGKRKNTTVDPSRDAANHRGNHA